MSEISPAGGGFFIFRLVSLVSQRLFKRHNVLAVVMPSDSFNSPNAYKTIPALGLFREEAAGHTQLPVAGMKETNHGLTLTIYLLFLCIKH